MTPSNLPPGVTDAMIEDQIAEVAECPICGAEIDPNWCWCGSPLGAHWGEGHSFVPAGCTCYYDGAKT